MINGESSMLMNHVGENVSKRTSDVGILVDGFYFFIWALTMSFS